MGIDLETLLEELREFQDNRLNYWKLCIGYKGKAIDEKISELEHLLRDIYEDRNV